MTRRLYLTVDTWREIGKEDLPALQEMGNLDVMQLRPHGQSGQTLFCTGNNPHIEWLYITPERILDVNKTGTGTAFVIATVVAPSLNQVLAWNGIDWVNQSLAPLVSAITSLNGSTVATQFIVGQDDINVSSLLGTTTIARSVAVAGSHVMIPVDWSSAAPGSQAVAAANQVHVFDFALERKLTVISVHFEVRGANAGTFGAVGVYSSAGVLLLSSGPVSTATTGIKSITLGSSVTLPPGKYRFAWTCSSTGPSFTTIADATNFTNILNAGTTHVGTAANLSVLGVLPATLGLVTPITRNIIVAKLQG